MTEKDKATPVEEVSTSQRVVNKIIWAFLGLAFFGVGLMLFWAFQPSKVITVNNEPFPVRTIRENASANGVVILNVDYCKHVEAKGEVRISFIDSNHEVFLPISEENLKVGCNRQEFPILIPSVIDPGEYRVKFRIFYDINPLKQNIQNEFQSQPFTIDADAAGTKTNE